MNPYTGTRNTSFVLVEVLFEPDMFTIDGEDVKIDVYVTPSVSTSMKNIRAVRITHLPSSIVAACEEQFPAKLSEVKGHAWRLLRARIINDAIHWDFWRRKYVHDPYTLVKDMITGKESDRLREILDGELSLIADWG